MRILTVVCFCTFWFRIIYREPFNEWGIWSRYIATEVGKRIQSTRLLMVERVWLRFLSFKKVSSHSWDLESIGHDAVRLQNSIELHWGGRGMGMIDMWFLLVRNTALACSEFSAVLKLLSRLTSKPISLYSVWSIQQPVPIISGSPLFFEPWDWEPWVSEIMFKWFSTFCAVFGIKSSYNLGEIE